MNLGKHTRLKIYNARLLIRNAKKELEEAESECSDDEDMKTISHYILRLEGIDSGLSTILNTSKDEPILSSNTKKG